eukprot:m.84834 g.84834  ORF g.84834 m.84834 type:complete len:278 (+) comp50852_c0_seq6:202-1035(+)
MIGVGPYLSQFEDPADAPPPFVIETITARRERKARERDEKHKAILATYREAWDPHSNPDATKNAFKTVFIGRLSFETTEATLKKECERYGSTREIKLVKDHNGKSRGYAFVEFNHERDMLSAYKHMDGQKIDGKRVVVDVERARTVKDWLPRRLGGGLGGTRIGHPSRNIKHSGRFDLGTHYLDEDRDRERSDRDRSDRDRSDRDRSDRDRSDRDRSDRDRDRDRSDRDRDYRSDRDRDRERDYRSDRYESSSSRGSYQSKGPAGGANLEPLGPRRV